jgi:hypothetical protein
MIYRPKPKDAKGGGKETSTASASGDTSKVESTASTVTATESEARDKKLDIKHKAKRLSPEEMEGGNFVRVPVIVKKGDTEK